MGNKLCVDQDGVLADFDTFVSGLLGRTFEEHENELGNEDAWKHLLRLCPNLYRVLPVMRGAERLVREIMNADIAGEVSILTGVPSRVAFRHAIKDKQDWMGSCFPHQFDGVYFGPYSVDKQKHCNPGDVLLDDRPLNIQQWESKGGIGIVYDGKAADIDKEIDRVMNEIIIATKGWNW